VPNPQNLRPPWKPGETGNPRGRPPRNRQIDDLLELLDETAGAERAISKAWLKKLLEGNVAHLKEYLDRRDGPVPKEVNTTEHQEIKTKKRVGGKPRNRRDGKAG
jgi:hypothetical protein